MGGLSKTEATVVETREDDDEPKTFEEIGLDPRLVRALAKNSISEPTPIQRVGIPLILEGKDVVARANTGSGKTYTYLLPMLHKLFSENVLEKTGPRALVLVPSKELCKQVCNVATSLLEYCRVQLNIAQLLSDMPLSDLKTAVAGKPEVLISTPSCITTCLSRSVIQANSFQSSLSMLVLDEADLLLSFGYEDDLKSLISYVPRQCQCLLMTASPSDDSGGPDVEKLKRLVLHNPVVLTLSNEGNSKQDIIPKSIEQFWISCTARDKLLYVLALLKLEVIRKKVLIFVNSIDTGFQLKLYLEQFGLKSVILNAELPQTSRLHILEGFNAGLYDYLIATDLSQQKDEKTTRERHVKSKKLKKHLKEKLDSEFGVVRGIDFKNVYTVINFDMPQNSTGYVHRVGRTGRAQKSGAAISLVSTEEEDIFQEIKQILGDTEESNVLVPFTMLTCDAVESLRYRAEDVAKGVTKLAIRESRALDLRNEILNSEKLKAHFEENPRDLDLLKHDKMLSKKLPPTHLRDVPEYLVDPTTKEASKIVKLTQAAINVGRSKKRSGYNRRFGKSKDPLKTFSAEKKSHKATRKRDHKEGTENGKMKKKRKT